MGVVGSNPIISTTKDRRARETGLFLLRRPRVRLPERALREGNQVGAVGSNPIISTTVFAGHRVILDDLFSFIKECVG